MTELLSDAARVVHVSACAAERHAAAAAWLAALPANASALVLVPSASAGAWLMAAALAPGAARFAWRRRTLEQHCQALAAPALLTAGGSVLHGMAMQAVCLRALQDLAERRQLGRFAAVSDKPGFVRSLAQTLLELRLAQITPEQLAAHDADLAHCLSAYEAALADDKLIDAAALYAMASERAACEASAHLLALDVPVANAAEAALVHALGRVTEHAWASVPLADALSLAAWQRALGDSAHELHTPPRDTGDLGRLQAQLFVGASKLTAASNQSRDGHVRFLSSPTESRESSEVVREILTAAHSGVPFERMAVLVRAVDNYRAVLEEAFTRANVPAHFDSGVRRPMPEGRAFALLLACAEHGLSARRFAEYLSLDVMPRAAAGPSSPRHWERLLVEAAVAGGRQRWATRLQGLARRWQTEAEATNQDPARREALERQRLALAELERFALPLLDALAALPTRASCEVWLPALHALAEQALHDPSSVHELLLALPALGARTQLSLREIAALLAPHLNALIVSSQGYGAGAVFVASIAEARGRRFERVFVLGLAERLFPPRLLEDPLLPDRVRRALSPALACLPERVAQERLGLRLAAGSASEQLCLSFPRYDSEQGRPRVPSFYGLEALEAIHGRLVGWSELSERAETGAAARMGWPAPEAPERAIDDAEYDLAVLARAARDDLRRVGALRYLLDANPHLARALRFRARRWELQKFVAADGFVVTDPRARELLAKHALTARSYSASALAQLAICPYRFYLHAIVRVAELDGPSELSELGPREHGLLFHDVLHRLFVRWLAERPLPLSAAEPGSTQRALELAFSAVRSEAHERYAPAIARVFDTTLNSLWRDLGGLLERQQQDLTWTPEASELALRSPDAQAKDVTLESGIRLVGAIDLVERRSVAAANGGTKQVLRATDFKTGRAPARLGVTQGAHVLQPLLYALALERMYPEAEVSGGRLYFCTQEQRYISHEVPLGERARGVARELFQAIDDMLRQGFLPAAPERDACLSCEFRAICGPHEEERVRRVKQRDGERLRSLQLLRRLP